MGYSGGLPVDDYLGGALSTIQEDVNTAKAWLDDFYETEFCGFTDEEHSIIGACKEFASFAGGPKSFWQTLAKQEALRGGDDSPFNGCETNGICNFSTLLMGIFGDIYIGPMSQGSDGDSRQKLIPVLYIPSKTPMKVADIVNGLLEGGSDFRLPGMFLPSGATGPGDYTDAPLTDITSLQFGEKAEDALAKIADAISSGDASYMDSETIEFINQQVLPLWQVINVFAYQGDAGIASVESGIIKKYAAVSNAYFFLQDVAKLASTNIDKYMNTLERGKDYAAVSKEEFQAAAKTLKGKIKEFRRALTVSYRNVLETFHKALDNVTRMSMLEKEITGRLMDQFGYSPFKFYK